MNWLMSASAGSNGVSTFFRDLDESFAGIAFCTGAPTFKAVSDVAAGFTTAATVVDFPRYLCGSFEGGNIAVHGAANAIVVAAGLMAEAYATFGGNFAFDTGTGANICFRGSDKRPSFVPAAILLLSLACKTADALRVFNEPSLAGGKVSCTTGAEICLRGSEERLRFIAAAALLAFILAFSSGVLLFVWSRFLFPAIPISDIFFNCTVSIIARCQSHKYLHDSDSE
mmetsp:Transcript_18173/g.32913  ORF Transcript_18173/g.32913 Transcript_18173/m.32913 type:complete len:227 (+) Transcript_18173:266-946(+)